MADLNILSIKALGQANDGKYYIDSNDSIYLVEDECDIVVKEGSYVKIIDKTSNNDINVEVLDSSVCEYYIINNNSNYEFKVFGELRVLEVSINSANKKFIVSLEKENASCDVKNLSVLDNAKSYYEQKIVHNSKLTFSNIQNVGIAMNGASIVFDTTGKIEKGMSKSKCAQLSRGIVMDDKSMIQAKPILLIDEFDCFANHGASIGKMSDEDLFYLMSRGLTKNQAFLLILGGIIRPFIESIPNEEIRNELEEQIRIRTEE